MANSPATALLLPCRLCSPSAVSSAKLDPAHMPITHITFQYIVSCPLLKALRTFKPWQTHLPLLCCSYAGFSPHPLSAVKYGACIQSEDTHHTPLPRAAPSKCIHRPEFLTSMPGYSSSQISNSGSQVCLSTDQDTCLHIASLDLLMPISFSRMPISFCGTPSQGPAVLLSSTHCMLHRVETSAQRHNLSRSFWQLLLGQGLTILTHGGCAESGGTLGLQHGASQKPSANFCAPANLDHWLVACHGHEPVIVLWR